MATMEKNRLQIMPKELHQSINTLLKSLNQQIDKLTEKLDKLVAQVKEWRVKSEILTSVPGVGKVLSYTLLSEMPELGKVRTSRRTALALIAATVQGIQLRACRGLLKLNNAEMVLLSKPRRARLTAVFAALQFLRRTRAIRCKLRLASIHFKHTQSKHGTYSVGQCRREASRDSSL
ncbi:hypothetical protein [Shewanella sp. Isolate7]|uniref:hypothetical protein n=1 Tax=Shewanella sp. Isolate7 TaxID=2908528 RepID=UPI001EFD7C67|nr:hypothetical protein [Shewanella sp. Isolate7]MCG9723513.1 hypothetical protein [Shewanella sp. Isolate7]